MNDPHSKSAQSTDCSYAMYVCGGQYAHYLFVPGAVLAVLHVPEHWLYMGLPLMVFAADWLLRW